jgi:PncC family amidohydrolase
MSEPLETILGRELSRRGLSLAVAESCTGGLISYLVTNVPGSSDYFKGGVTVYSNEAKTTLLGVSPETISTHGAVSEQTVLEMARGVRRMFAADLGISVSGIAGPGGGTAEKPVGTTWIGFSGLIAEGGFHNIFPGHRLDVKQQAARKALQIALDYLKAS